MFGPISGVKFVQFPGYHITVGLVWNLKIKVFFKAVNHTVLLAINLSVFPYENEG
jgi:hypothetical protein